MEGVLKSWALPKDPASLNDGVKRLAIQTEDHPIDFAFFEGEIKEGNYGAGTIKIYDRGTCRVTDSKPNQKYIVEINGQKLKGTFVLLKFKENWLFFKKK
jgi:DNA ligase D-like protein (predicted 3'-phosphoesterase)